MLRLTGTLLALTLLVAVPARAFDLFNMKNSLIQFALEQISTDDFTITAETVESPGDGVTDLVGVEIADREGVWFTAERMGLQWNASRILRGELEINRLGASGVRILRQPRGEVEVKEDAEIAQTDDDPFDWPRAPLATRIDEIALTDVVLAPGVLAEQSLGFDATGAARDEGDEQSVRLVMRRTDRVEGEIRLDYLRDFAAGTLRANVTALEAPGGLVAEFAGLPPGSAASLDLRADGPLTDWGLDLALVAERMLEAGGRARIDLEGPLAVQARFGVTPGPALPETYRAVLGSEARLDVDIAEADGVIGIREARLASPALNLAARGSYTREGGLVDLDVDLAGEAALSDLAEGVSFDGFGFTGRVRGALDDLTATGEARLAGLTTAPADIGAARLATEVRIAGSRIDFGIDGGIERVRLDRIGPDLLGDADLGVRGSYDADRVSLDGLAFRSRPLTVEASGAVDLAAESAALDYALSTPDLAPIAAAYDADAGGRLAVTGRVEGPFAGVRLTGTAGFEALAFEGEDYGRLELTHDIVAGETIAGGADLRGSGSRFGPIAADVDLALAGERLDLSRVSAEALGVGIDGALVYALDTGLADGSVALDAPDLATVAAALEQPVTGALAGRVRLTPAAGEQRVGLDLTGARIAGFGAVLDRLTLVGTVEDALGAPALDAELTALGAAYDPLDARIGRLEATLDATDLTGAPAAQVDLTAGDLAYQEARIGRLSARLDGRDLVAAPSGTLSLDLAEAAGFGAELSQADLRAEIENALAAVPRGTVRLRTGRLSAGGATVATAALDATLDDAAEDGRLTADLSTGAISAGGARIASATATATVDGAVGTAPAVAARLRTGGIDAGGATVAGLSLEAEVPDALAADPAITARLDTGAIEAGGAALSGIAARVEGVLSALGVRITTEGTAGDKPLSLETAARVNATAPAPVVRVDTLVARYDTAEASLRAPLTVTAGDSVTLRGLDMALPGGGLSGDAALHPSGAEADLALALSDLALLAELAGAPVSAGALDARIALDSRAGRAGGTATIAARGLRFEEAVADIGALDITLDGSWDGRRAALDAALAGPFGTPVRIEAALPVRPSGGPVPRLVESGEVDARIRWAGDVGALWVLVPAPGHVLDGALDIDLGIGGTVAEPAIEGRLALTEGRYENLDIGTILTDLTVSSSIAGLDTLELDLEARDAAEGRVTAEVAVDPETVRATLQSNGAVLVRRDDATAAISLDLLAEGPLTGPDVSGTVTVDRAEVRLVNATPPSVVTLGDVRIKGVPVEPEEVGPGGEVALDIRVRAPRDVFVRGRGLDSEWAIALDVGGTAARPRVTGDISRVRGVLTLIGTAFDLETGRIDFSGGREIDPRLDIRFQAEENGITGGIAVSGTGSEPEIGFYSRPALPQGEVLPRLLFGKPSQSLTAGQALRLASGIATLMDGTGGPVDAVRGAVGLDQLSIDPEGDTATVTVGKNIGDDVFVGARQSVDGAESRVFVEVEVFPQVTVDSEVDQEGAASVGVNWRKDF